MKIEREYIESLVWEYGELKGLPYYKREKINDKVSAYISDYIDIYFETETLERIGDITESDVRCSWKRYYNARIAYGWDGSKKTRKEMVKTLCTRADYSTAKAILLEEYAKRTK